MKNLKGIKTEDFSPKWVSFQSLEKEKFLFLKGENCLFIFGHNYGHEFEEEKCDANQLRMSLEVGKMRS